MNEADQIADDKWQLTLSFSTGETIGNGGDSDQHLCGIAVPWLYLLPCWIVGLILSDFLICRRDLRCVDFFNVKVSNL